MYHPSYRALCRDSLMRVSYTKEIQYKGVLTRLYFWKRLNRRYCTISVMRCTMILYSCRCTNQLVTGWTVWSYRSKTKCEFIIPLNNYRRNYRYFFAAVPSKDRNSGLQAFETRITDYCSGYKVNSWIEVPERDYNRSFLSIYIWFSIFSKFLVNPVPSKSSHSSQLV